MTVQFPARPPAGAAEAEALGVESASGAGEERSPEKK